MHSLQRIFQGEFPADDHERAATRHARLKHIRVRPVDHGGGAVNGRLRSHDIQHRRNAKLVLNYLKSSFAGRNE
jgi:hypothetical protein